MDPIQVALNAVAVPGAAAAVVFFAVRALTKGRGGATGVGPAIAAGFIAAFLAIAGLPTFPPKEAWHWLPFVAVLTAAVGTVEARLSAVVRTGLQLAVLFPAVFAAVPHAERQSDATYAIAVAAFFSTRSLAWLERRGGAGPTLVPVGVTAAAIAVALLVFSGWAILGMLCGALAAATAVCLALGWKFPTHARDAALPASMLVAAAAAGGANYAELPIASAILLAVAPAGGALAVSLLARRGGAVRLMLRAAGGAAIPAGIAVALAAHAAPKFEY